MNPRTDLALERVLSAGTMPPGASCREETLYGIPCTSVEIKGEEAAASLGKPEGVYYTLHCPPFSQAAPDLPSQAEAAAALIARLLPKEGAVLTVGLGNAAITPDALGPEVSRLLLATRHIPPEAMPPSFPKLRPSAVIAPGVLGQTGIESAEIIAALVKEIRPSAVIAVDALAAGELSRLGTTLQICDSGISPGSGVRNRRKELSRRTLGVPVIAVGIPTVADCAREDGPPMMVTPREIDTIILNAAKVIAFAIDRALQPSLSFEDLTALSS
ncbi:MAG TPA: GPR endopeptidase [Candidatus Merdivicinus intestinigallinarum]|nr:GPR endopeptidase [Candidatus Merdivicinus intestinigallinarum]